MYFKEENKFKNHWSVQFSISNLSHLLLSSKGNYNTLRKFFGKEHLYEKVSEKLSSQFLSEKIKIEVITYAIVYNNGK